MSANDKKLNGFNQIEVDEDVGSEFSGFDPKDWQLWMISTPKDFPESKLQNITLDAKKSSELEVLDNNGKQTNYVFDGIKRDKKSSKAIIIHGDVSTSSYQCMQVTNTIRARENIPSSQNPKVKKFLPRPPAPNMSEDLCERWKPVGWG